MNLEFFTGLALISFALAALAYIVAGLVGFRINDLTRVRHYFANAFQQVAPSETKSVNAHLVGLIGKVIAHSADTARPMRVRLNLESWPARLNSTADSAFSVGAAVKVTKVDGPVLVVEAAGDVAESNA